jgi:hypothetical protein
MRGDYAHALIEAQRIYVPDLIFGSIARAMAHAALGDRPAAAKAVAALLAVDPAFGNHVVDDMAGRNLHPDLILAIVAGLAEAGLVISDAQASKLY